METGSEANLSIVTSPLEEAPAGIPQIMIEDDTYIISKLPEEYPLERVDQL